VAAFVSLDQVHRSVPFRTMSDSPRVPSSASRCCSSPAYQTRSVCDPEISEVKSELSPGASCERSGRPRSAFCTTVPEMLVRLAVCTSTRSSAALRGGSVDVASAEIAVSAVAPSAMATIAPGTAQRIAGWVLVTDIGDFLRGVERSREPASSGTSHGRG